MAHCLRCGSHRVRRTRRRLTDTIGPLKGHGKYRCSACGWVGWKEIPNRLNRLTDPPRAISIALLALVIGVVVLANAKGCTVVPPAFDEWGDIIPPER